MCLYCNNNIIDNIVNFSNIQSIKIHKIIIDKNNDKEPLYLKACNCEKQIYQQEFINRIYGYNYYNNNKNQGYCQYTIQPKIEKYKKIFIKN